MVYNLTSFANDPILNRSINYITVFGCYPLTCVWISIAKTMFQYSTIGTMTHDRKMICCHCRTDRKLSVFMYLYVLQYHIVKRRMC